MFRFHAAKFVRLLDWYVIPHAPGLIRLLLSRHQSSHEFGLNLKVMSACSRLQRECTLMPVCERASGEEPMVRNGFVCVAYKASHGTACVVDIESIVPMTIAFAPSICEDRLCSRVDGAREIRNPVSTRILGHIESFIRLINQLAQ